MGCHFHCAGKLGRHSISAELLQPAELVSGVICQVAVEPELAALLANFLYSNEGGLEGWRPSSVLSAMSYCSSHERMILPGYHRKAACVMLLSCCCSSGG